MIWKLLLPFTARHTPRESSTSRQVVVLRRILDHSARGPLVIDTTPSPFRIIEISTRHTRHATPRVIRIIRRTSIVSVSAPATTAASAPASVRPAPIVVTIVSVITRVRIAVVV